MHRGSRTHSGPPEQSARVVASKKRKPDPFERDFHSSTNDQPQLKFLSLADISEHRVERISFAHPGGFKKSLIRGGYIHNLSFGKR